MDAEMGIATADAMAAERASMMQADAWRSLLMILLAAGGVALFALRRINKYALTALLGAVMLLDLVPVDLRFLSHDDFISARRRQITATAADKAILADKDPASASSTSRSARFRTPRPPISTVRSAATTAPSWPAIRT